MPTTTLKFSSSVKQFAIRTRMLWLALGVAASLSACVTALVAGAVIATVDIIHDRRTVGEYIDDSAIEIKARNILVSTNEIREAAHVKPVSWNGILLVTGEIDNEAVKRNVVSQFGEIQGVRQVVDETTITDKTRIGVRTNDAWISGKVKSRLLLKTGLDANRVKVVTTRGSVYLMGIVTLDEATDAVEYARTVRGVERVVKVFEYQEG
ncbi:BON domain-containing protein [Arenicella xantha]|uniref:Osmotically-inducible protein OsmY n=1 Tax=Arenicella xantha TaxID=644221 RepID=A0A395JJB4_9GAMM|nr:BON domain-containing protein [Arenicella xantha]RBP49849.1 osmotically-inducible protein OsmY [Arenicella xantha]